MKIAVLAGAESIHSLRWVEYLADRDHEVHWLSIAPFGTTPLDVKAYEIDPYLSGVYDGTDPDATGVLLNPRGALGLLRGVARVRKILAAVRPDVFHIHSVGTYGLVGTLSRFRPRVLTAWGSDVLIGGGSAFKRPLIKLVLRTADVLTCDAYHMKEAMVSLGADSAKIHVVFFGTDTDKFRPDLNGWHMRERLGIADRLVIVSTRNFLPIYDVATLVRAMPRVLKQVPDAVCVLAGSGPERQALVALGNQLGVSNSLRFVGSIDPGEMPHLLATADIYVSTSLSDAGLAASTAEAMACGLPVVVTDSAENRIWVEDGTGGFVVPPGTPDLLADKLISLARDSGQRKAFGAYNRPIIDERNNYRLEMRKIERIYETMIGAVTVSK